MTKFLIPPFVLGFRWLPRSQRFGFARWVAVGLRPLFYLRRWKWGPLPLLDGYREDALRFVVERLCDHNLEFDPGVRVQGRECLKTTGFLVVSGHFLLNRLLVRWLFDQGFKTTSVRSVRIPDQCIFGTKAPFDVIQSDSLALVKARQRVAAGHVVLIDLDSPTPKEGYREIKTPVGPRYISDATFRFAERAGIPVLFGSSRIAADGAVLLTFVAPSSNQSVVLMDEFCRFLGAEAAQVKQVKQWSRNPNE